LTNELFDEVNGELDLFEIKTIGRIFRQVIVSGRTGSVINAPNLHRPITAGEKRPRIGGTSGNCKGSDGGET
jgi:hypothetical protein